MERIDLKAVTKSALLTVALALEFAQNTTKGEGAFLSTVEFGGRKWTNGRDVTIVREKEDRNWVWIETGVNPNRQPPDVTEG